jgi:GNAT superfamily N-acetyltransferase
VRARLSSQDADDVILESLERFRTHGAPGSWHVGPSMRPADIGERLMAHGFSYGGDIGMAVELPALPEEMTVPEDLEIERVRGEETLAAWRDTLAQGFGEGPVEAEWVGEMYRRIGLSDDVPWRHHLGRPGGAPVATSTLFVGAGVAGIFFVSTVEQAWRRGIGAALTLAPLQEAWEIGYRFGVLGASEMGYSVYRRLGFREYCRIGLYEWRPPTPIGR